MIIQFPPVDIQEEVKIIQAQVDDQRHDVITVLNKLSISQKTKNVKDKPNGKDQP